MSERQMESIENIRIDHRARYEFALSLINRGDRVLDAACGCGYGSKILSAKAGRVYSIDNSLEAIDYALENYSDTNIFYLMRDLPCELPIVDVVTSFETIEHVDNPLQVLKDFRAVSDKLICSVPNQDKLPFTKERFPFHHRHYTKIEFNDLLVAAGWRVIEWHGQAGAFSKVESNVNGRTLVAVCV